MTTATIPPTAVSELIDELISQLQPYSSFPLTNEPLSLAEQILATKQSPNHPSVPALIALMQQQCIETPAPLPVRYLQLLRLLTKPPEHRELLTQDLLSHLNAQLLQTTNFPQTLVQILALHLRCIESPNCKLNRDMFSRIIDLLAMHNAQAVLVIVELIRGLTKSDVCEIFEQVWYVGRLLFAMERIDPNQRHKLISLLKELIQQKRFRQNFLRVSGIGTLIGELKRAVAASNKSLVLTGLSCIYELLQASSLTQVIYDIRANNLLSIVMAAINNLVPQTESNVPSIAANYMEVILCLRIATHLMLDNQLNSKFSEEGGITVILKILVSLHPKSVHEPVIFEDLVEQHPQAKYELKLLLLRLLRYVCSLERNRKIFKRLLPPQLMGPFLDVGHFVKAVVKYEEVVKVFEKLDINTVKVEENENTMGSTGKIFGGKTANVAPNPRSLIGDYTIVEQLGQGAFGCVYLAKKGHNHYALKQLPYSGQSPEEVSIHRTFKHPHIVKFYESFNSGQSLYIVMQVVKGCNLSELVRNQSQKQEYFEEDTVWQILMALLSALRYLHVEKGVVHRDLNPSNVLVDQKLTAKVTDFGLAMVSASHIKSDSQNGKNLPQSQGNNFLGTLIYSAPQVVQNRPFSTKADIWSLGCILYQLLTLRPPFSSSNPFLLAKSIIGRQFVTPLPTEHYSPQLIKIVELCLTQDQAERPSATDLLRMMVERVVIWGDELREKQAAMSQEILQMNRRVHAPNQLGATAHARMFPMGGVSHISGFFNQNALDTTNQTAVVHHEPAPDPLLRTTHMVKLHSQVLSKLPDDPISKFLDIVRKMSLIASTQASTMKKSIKKYLVDTFYHKTLISDELSELQVKNQIQKLLSLSKQEIGMLKGVGKEGGRSITYEKMYFYVDELYESIKT